MARHICSEPVTCVSHQSRRSLSSRDRVQVRFVESVRGLTRLLGLVVTEASVLGRRERCAEGMGFRGVFGRSLACGRLWGGSAVAPCEACDARGEGMELGRVEGAVILRDDECARTAGGLLSLVREAQQP
jgi:hypothetical protein